MSFVQVDQVILQYYNALECFEDTESLFHREEVDLLRIKDGLKECCVKIESIILAEDNNCSFLVDLHQLRLHFLYLLELVDADISNPLVSSIRPSESKVNSDNPKLRNMVESCVEVPRVKGFEYIAGLWEIKRLLKTFVILPKTQPQLFENRKVFNSILLFGPPGTGKTQLVHALAYDAKAELFCVTASNIISPLVGQTEKEKTELLCQISQMESSTNVFLICATNCPWDLDTAFLRRFQKRIYIPLPDYNERRDLLTLFTKGTPLEESFNTWEHLISRTEGWSGSDLSNLVQEAMNAPILELEETKVWSKTSDGFYEPVTEEDINFGQFICEDLNRLPPHSVRARNVQPFDLFKTFGNTKATVKEFEIQKYENFCED